MAIPERRHVAERLHSAALHLLRRLREVDAEAEIGPSRLSVLSVLVFGDSSTVGELAAAEQVKASTMSKLVQGLEELGLVSRSAAKDRRSVILRATPQGRKLLLKARSRRLDLFTSMLQQASAADLDVLTKASDTIDRLLSQAQ
jgi:DNA-binding MarR family transcriptional regulator